eukprot:4419458-Pyramimonas_sp.AAC.1
MSTFPGARICCDLRVFLYGGPSPVSSILGCLRLFSHVGHTLRRDSGGPRRLGEARENPLVAPGDQKRPQTTSGGPKKSYKAPGGSTRPQKTPGGIDGPLFCGSNRR